MLHGVVKLNGQPVVGYKIVRHSPIFCVDDTIATYKWEMSRMTPLNETVHAAGALRHRYGDGMEVLLAKVLAIAGPILLVQERELIHKAELERIRAEKATERADREAARLTTKK